MISNQFENHDLVLVPLTPIHIGGGEEARLLPEDYRLSRELAAVERISVRAVLARLDPASRGALIKQFDHNSEGFIRELQNRATADDVLESIPISSVSSKSVDLSGEGHARRNQIDAFYRSGGQPMLPGSSLKGALRTAWLGAMWKLAERNNDKEPVQLPSLDAWARMSPKDRARQARDMEAKLLGRAQGQDATDTDPMRDVRVSDIVLEANCTRVDKVHAWKKDRDKYGFSDTGEMHRERLRSVVDGDAPPVIPIRIGLRSAMVKGIRDKLDPNRHHHPGRSPGDISILLAALDYQHSSLWKDDLESFFLAQDGERLRLALALFSQFVRGGTTAEAALVRLGWGSHAEAKSLGAVRRVERPQLRGPGRFAKAGSARHVIDLKGHPLPFGWALLIRDDAWVAKKPTAFLTPPTARAKMIARDTGNSRNNRGDSGPIDRRTNSALGSRNRYSKGDRVLVQGEVAILSDDVTEAMILKGDDEVSVSFNGDMDVIRVREIEGPA